jgi:hypothetical protein
LTLSPDKTIISHISGKDRDNFLGYTLYRKAYKRSKLVTISVTRNNPKKLQVFQPSENMVYFDYQNLDSEDINESDIESSENIESDSETESTMSYQSAQFRGSGHIKITIDKNRVLNRLALKRYATKNTYKPRERPELSVLEPQEIIQHYNSVLLGYGNFYYPIITRRSHLSRYFYIIYYSCLKTLATKYRLSIGGIRHKFGYKDVSYQYGKDQTTPHLRTNKLPTYNTRIVVRYIQNGKEKREVLLNYLELKARLIFTSLNQQVTKGLNSITSDFLTKLSTCFRYAVQLKKWKTTISESWIENTLRVLANFFHSYQENKSLYVVYAIIMYTLENTMTCHFQIYIALWLLKVKVLLKYQIIGTIRQLPHKLEKD